MKTRAPFIAAIVLATAAHAGDAVDTRVATDWLAQYGAALNARDAVRLAALFDATVPVVVYLTQGKDEPLTFTLTRAEYLQQTRALWRFASEDRYELSKPAFEAETVDGTLLMTFTQKERHVLFGTPTLQSSDLRVRLVLKNGVPRVAGIEAHTLQR